MCFYRINRQLKTMLIHDWVNQQLYKTVGTIKYIVALLKMTKAFLTGTKRNQ